MIEHASEDDTPLAGEIEVDESYFGGHRKGKRGRGAAGKMPVFGLLKRGGKVYARVIPDVKSRTLKPILERKIVPDSIVYSDTLNSYNVLDVAGFKHLRINHSKLFSENKNHINGIENFWNQAKRHLRRFNGIPREHFHLFLRECEWRFNTPQPKTTTNPTSSMGYRIYGMIIWYSPFIFDLRVEKWRLSCRALYCRIAGGVAERCYSHASCVVDAVDDVGAKDVVLEGEDFLSDITKGYVAGFVVATFGGGVELQTAGVAILQGDHGDGAVGVHGVSRRVMSRDGHSGT